MNLDGSRPIRENWDQLNEGFENVQVEMDAKRVELEGIKTEAISQDARINNLVVTAGDSGPEARDARVSSSSGVTYPTLKARLDGEMSNLINYLNYMPINGGSFDGDDPTGPVIDGGTY